MIITPPVTSGRFLTKCWSAGVGTMPRSRTSEPTDMRPDARALLIISEETRVSVATAILPPSTAPTLLPMRRASSQLRYSLAIPRMPLVPNIFISTSRPM